MHPRLATGIKPDLTPGTPTSKPDKDCSYSKLVNKIRGNQELQKAAVAAATDGVCAIDTNSPVHSATSSPTRIVPVSSGVSTPVLTGVAALSNPIVNTPFTPGVGINSSTPVLSSNLTPTAEESSCRKKRKSGEPKFKGLVDYPSFNRTVEGSGSEDEDGDEMNGSLSQNWKLSDSIPEKSGEPDYSNIKWPPPDIQMLIDKMASYIIKNGPEFEAMVRRRRKFKKLHFKFFVYLLF